MIIPTQVAVPAPGQHGILEEGRGERLGLLGLESAKVHLRLIAAGARGPLQIERQFRTGAGRLSGPQRESADGRGEMPGRLVEALLGGSLALAKAVFIVISQSGASPDLVTAVRSARRSGARTLAIVNATPSPLAEAAEFVLPICLVIGFATRFAAFGLLLMTLLIQFYVIPQLW